jgi:oligopeptide/dipeptide ABC transporter ATP-binding protein
MPNEPALLRAENLSMVYGTTDWIARKGKYRPALDSVSFSLAKGGTSGIVGESGSGKSTMARICAALLKPTGGKVMFDGTDLFAMTERIRRPLRRRFQVVFQDPFNSLNPRIKVLETVAEPIRTHHLAEGEASDRAALELLESVGIPSHLAGRYPHEMSGGQRQRVAIARALSTKPDLLIADEPVSSLDVSIQAQILNLLKDLQAKTGCAVMFVSHDLKIVSWMCSTVTVLYAGKVMERGNTEALYKDPLHPYTRHLLDSIPWLKGTAPRERKGKPPVQSVEAPVPVDGCPFVPRCPLARPECRTHHAVAQEVEQGRESSCLFAAKTREL